MGVCQDNLECGFSHLPQETLVFLRAAISPSQLSTIEEAVFSRCWAGLTYQEIADQLNYNEIYIRGVGSSLWQRLSKVLGQKVTKSNFQALLYQQLSEPMPLGETAVLPRKAAQFPIHPQLRSTVAPPASPAESIPEPATDYYIERSGSEAQCYRAIIQQGALLRIKAPRQMGKTTLMNRVLAYARQQQFRTVVVSLRLADADIFANLDRFLQWFCAIIGDQLGLTADPVQVWKPIFGSNYNCTNYFSSMLLPQLEGPVVIALDDVDVLFGYSEIATDFLGLLRAWREKAKHSDVETDAWYKLRLIVVHSTEVYIPLHQHQSPFNVGLSIELPELDPAQVHELAQRYGVMWTDQDVTALMDLVGGKPDLVRLTLDWVASQQVSLASVLEAATTATSIYHEHLRQQFRLIQKYPDLIPLLAQVMNQEQAVTFAPAQAFQLESLGMVKLQGQAASPSCALYRHYFGPLLTAS